MSIVDRSEFSSSVDLPQKESAVVELFMYAYFDGEHAALQYERGKRDGQDTLIARITGLSKGIAVQSSLTPKPGDDATPQQMLDRARRNVISCLFVAGIKAANRRYERFIAPPTAGANASIC